MPASDPTTATYHTKLQGEQWVMVVEERGKAVTYHAASKFGAEVMISLEQKRRAGVAPYCANFPGSCDLGAD